jgi:hypothetical protein
MFNVLMDNYKVSETANDFESTTMIAVIDSNQMHESIEELLSIITLGPVIIINPQPGL